MRKLNVKTIKESPDLIKVDSNQTLTSQFPKDEVLKRIDSAKEFEKGQSIDTLRQLVEDYKKKEYHTKPKEFSKKEISTTGETAYQRAIFLSEKTKLNTIGEVVWNDLELPVVFNESPRRRCIDLVGTLNDKTSVLCELKFASKKSNSNSPIYAAIELLIYYYLILDNYEELDKKKVFHKNGKPFKWSNFNHNPILIVGANDKYWTYWQKRYKKRKNEIESWCRSLSSLITIRFSSSPDFDFEEQKGTKEKYEPSVSDKREWTEVYL